MTLSRQLMALATSSLVSRAARGSLLRFTKLALELERQVIPKPDVLQTRALEDARQKIVHLRARVTELERIKRSIIDTRNLKKRVEYQEKEMSQQQIRYGKLAEKYNVLKHPNTETKP